MATFDNPQGSKDVKQPFGSASLQASTANQSAALPFGFPSLTVPKPSSTFSDSALKSKPFFTNVPAVVKPSATTFSFLPPSSGAGGAFTFSSKNDENKSVGATQSVVIPSQDSKFSFNVTKKPESTALQSSENKGLSFSSNAANTAPKFGLSSLLNSGASSANVSKSAATTQQPVATSSSLFTALAGQPLSGFGNKDANQSKPFSFPSQTFGSKTPTSQPFSIDGSNENSSNLIITSAHSLKPQESVKSILSTAATKETAPTSTTSASAFSFKVNTSTLSSTPFSTNQSTFTQSPVNLTQTKEDVSTTDSPLNLAGASSQNVATSESKTVSLESIIASALDKKTPLSETEQANQETFKNLFSPETSASSLTFSSTSSQQQSTSVTTTSTKSIFGQAALLAVSSSAPSTTTTAATNLANAPSTTTPKIVSEQDTGTTATSTLSDQTATSTSPNTVFGSPPNTTAPNSAVFGQQPATAAGVPAFGQVAASVSSPAAATTSAPVFGQSATGSTPSFFSQAATSQPSFFGGQATTTQSSSIFGQPATTGSTFFNQPASTEATPATQNQVFGATGTTTAAGSFFSQPLGGQTSVFGSNAANTAGSTGFGSQPSSASGFSFGKSTFGQQTQGLVFLQYC